MICSKRKEFAPSGSKSYPFRMNPFSEGRQKQTLKELPPLKDNSFPLKSSQRSPIWIFCESPKYIYLFTDRFLLVWKLVTKTHLYNFEPPKPHFNIVSLGFTGVYIIFFIFLKHIDCGYSLEASRQGGSNEYPQSMS